MKKYLIIDTWNGEGYTDSNVTLMEFKSVMAAERYCKEMAQHQLNAVYRDDEDNCDREAERYEEDGYVCFYDICEDNGAYHYIELDDSFYGITLNPCINDYDVFSDKNMFQDAINFAIDNGDEDDVVELQSYGVHRKFIHHGAGDGDAMFFMVDKIIEEFEQEKRALENESYTLKRLRALLETLDRSTEHHTTLYNHTHSLAKEERNTCPDTLDWFEGGDGCEYEVWKDENTGKLYKVGIEIKRDFANMTEVESLFKAKFG